MKRVWCWAMLVLLAASSASAQAQPAAAGSAAERSAAARSKATFSVVVKAPTPARLEQVYFALVPRGVARRRPAAEMVGDARKAALRLEVPAGTYRWVVGAPGLALHYGEEVKLVAGAEHRASVDMTPLVAIEGVVRNQQGKPIEGAVVGHLRALSDAMPGSLSTRARSLLVSNFKVLSSKDGTFQVPVVPGWRHFVWIEKPGFAPATLRDVLVEAEGLKVSAIQLVPGGRLQVVWQGKAKEDGVRLEIRPVDTTWFDNRGLKRGWLLWDREAHGRKQAWPSLMAGTYEVWAKGPAAGDHELLPLRLAADIKLRPGSETQVEVELPTVASLAASSAPSALVQVISGADGRPVAQVELAAVPEAAVDDFMKALRRGGKRPPVETRRTDEHGWARFPNMPAGMAHFVATVVAPVVATEGAPVIPTEGAPAGATGAGQPWPYLSQAYEFVAGHELVVEIELPENGAIEIEPVLSDDLRDAAKGVQITLGDASGGHGKRWRSRTARLGGATTVLFEDIPPGAWRASAIIELEGGMKHVTGQAEVELAPGATERVELEVEAALFRGRVTYLGQPMEAAISLRPVEHVVGRNPPRTYSDEDGSFVVPIETPGWYETSVSVESLKAIAELGRIHFDDPENELALELPAGRIVGRVVDGDGQPVPAASVQGRAFGEAERGHGAGEPGPGEHRPGASIRRLGTRGDEQGRFVFEMVAAGTWSVQAEKEGAKSIAETVALTGTAEERTIELLIEEQAVVLGRVVEASGLPRAGVRVGISPLAGGGAMPVSHGATTDAEGSFEIRANDLVGQRANVVVSAVGRARLQTIHDPIEVVVPSQGGQVTLRREQPWPRNPKPPLPYALVAADGAYLFLAAQASFVRAAPETPNIWELANLAPGPWALVHLISTADYQALASGAGAGLRPLARFEVVAGGSVVVEVP